MRLLHTSDWHLGHSLHQLPRELEHQRFLDWLAEVAISERIDALLVTGDVFDSSNPSARAERMYFEFLSRITSSLPNLDVVVIGGNHDSPGRLEAPAALLSSMGIRVIGRALAGDVDFDPSSLVIPITADGEVRAQVVAVPFLRPADLPAGFADDYAGGVREVYRQVAERARDRLRAGQSLVATGHLYAVGCDVSKLSERRIFGGHEHALPGDIFPDDAAYVALGHLHKAQRVGRRENVRYAGSPIPLSLAEANYRHQVCIVELEEQAAEIRQLAIPRSVDIVRIPTRGAAPLDDVLADLAELPDDGPDDLRPFLEVVVRLDKPEPSLRHQIEEMLTDRWPRLARLGVEYTGTGSVLAHGEASELRDLEPEEVFVRRYQRDHDGAVPDQLLTAFREIAARAEDELA